MAPIKRSEFPQSLSRLKWAAKIKTGPDVSEILGFTQASTDLTVAGASQLLSGAMVDVASVESVEVTQSRGLLERLAFGPNPHQAFQIVPLPITVSLRLTKIVLKKTPKAEQLFNFYPANLLHQQYPFVIQLRDNVQTATDGSEINGVEHWFFGCWFADSTVRYDITDRADTRLIQSATVKVSRMLTLDATAGGSFAAAVGREVFASVLASGENQNLLDDLELT